LLPEWLIKIG